MKATTFKDRDEQEMKTDDKNKLWITKILQKKTNFISGMINSSCKVKNAVAVQDGDFKSSSDAIIWKLVVLGTLVVKNKLPP